MPKGQYQVGLPSNVQTRTDRVPASYGFTSQLQQQTPRLQIWYDLISSEYNCPILRRVHLWSYGRLSVLTASQAQGPMPKPRLQTDDQRSHASSLPRANSYTTSLHNNDALCYSHLLTSTLQLGWVQYTRHLYWQLQPLSQSPPDYSLFIPAFDWAS